MTCLDERAAAALVAGRLGAAEADALVAHVDECPACRALVAAAEASLAHAGRAARAAGSDAPLDADTEITPGFGIAGGGGIRAGLDFQPGDVIDGKYRVERVLGEGGMGLVIAATHLHLRQRVALKFMRLEAMKIPEAAARFNREARAAARLRGEHVCRVLDMGAAPNGAPYIVIEYLEGEDLGECLRRRGPLPPADAVELILQACDAMAEAHAIGIVHRDLKPANLFLARGTDGALCVKVLDFGISKFVGAETTADMVVTNTKALMGSPLYMAPEQLLSAREVDARADIWALGTILFQLLAGRTPFVGESLPEIVAQVLHDRPPALRELAPAVPPALAEVVARCLERERDRRPASVAVLAGYLAGFAPAGAAHLPGRISAVMGVSSEQVGVAPRPATSQPAPARWRGWLAMAGILAVGAVLATAIASLGGRPPRPHRGGPPPPGLAPAGTSSTAIAPPPGPGKAAASPAHPAADAAAPAASAARAARGNSRAPAPHPARAAASSRRREHSRRPHHRHRGAVRHVAKARRQQPAGGGAPALLDPGEAGGSGGGAAPKSRKAPRKPATAPASGDGVLDPKL